MTMNAFLSRSIFVPPRQHAKTYPDPMSVSATRAMLETEKIVRVRNDQLNKVIGD